MSSRVVDIVKEITSKTSMANIVAGIILAVGIIGALITHNTDLLKNLCYLAAGYLFGTAMAKKT